MTGIDHVFYRHGPSSGFANVRCARATLPPVGQPAATSDKVGYGLYLALQILPFWALRSSGAKDAGRLYERLSKLRWQGSMV